MDDERAVQADRLAELVAALTGADDVDSAEATGRRAARPGGPDSLAIVAHAILDLRESERAMRVTPYLERPYQPTIDLRTSDPRTEEDRRFRRPERLPASGW